MLFEWVKNTYTRNKPALCLSVVLGLTRFLGVIESYFVESVTRNPSHQEAEYSIENSSSHNFLNTSSQNHQHLYWTKGEQEIYKTIRDFSPVFSLLFGGIFSDRYGGQHVVTAGLSVCSLVMATCYFVFLQSKLLSLALVVVRRGGEGLVIVAVYSLTAKVTPHGQRTMFVSIIFVGVSVGFYLGKIVSAMKYRWENVCEFSAFLAFVTVIWWWIAYKRNGFLKVRRLKRVPLKNLITAASFYIVCLLPFTRYSVEYIASKNYKIQEIRFDFKVVVKWTMLFIFCMTKILGLLFCGACSDILISKGTVSTTAVRRIFISVSFVSLFLLLAISSYWHKVQEVTLSVSVAIHFILCLIWATCITTMLDFSSSCAGIVTGIGYIVAIGLNYPLFKALTQVFDPSNHPKENVSGWSKLFFTVAFLGLLCSLPLLCIKFKRLSNRKNPRSKRGSVNTEDSSSVHTGDNSPVHIEDSSSVQK